MQPIRLILANHYRPLLKELRRLVEQQPHLQITGEATEGLTLLNLVRFAERGTPLIVILDLSLPNVSWTEAIRKIKADHPDARILILSMHQDEEYLRQALLAGAEGYLLKENVGEEFLQAIETIRMGRVYIPPAFARVAPIT